MTVIKKLFKKFLGFEDLDMENDSLTEEYAEEVNVNTKESSYQSNAYKQEEITLYPKSFSDACVIVEHIEAGNIVTIDLSDVEIDISKRITDFVLGAIYALNGDVEKVSKRVFRFWINQ